MLMEDFVEVSLSPGVIGDQRKTVTPSAWQEGEEEVKPKEIVLEQTKEKKSKSKYENIVTVVNNASAHILHYIVCIGTCTCTMYMCCTCKWLSIVYLSAHVHVQLVTVINNNYNIWDYYCYVVM